MSRVWWQISDLFVFLICFSECQAELACKITLVKTVLLFRYRLGNFLLFLIYSLIISNDNESHTNQNVLSHDAYWLCDCSAGAWWLAYWHSYHLFQRSQRYCRCCLLVIDNHSSFRAQLVVQKVRSTYTGLNCYLWLLPCLAGCLVVAVTFVTNGLSTLFFSTNL